MSRRRVQVVAPASARADARGRAAARMAPHELLLAATIERALLDAQRGGAHADEAREFLLTSPTWGAALGLDLAPLPALAMKALGE